MAAYRTSAAAGGTAGTTDRAVSITPAVGDLLVVFVSLTGNTNATPTMSDNNGSGTYARVAQAFWNAGADNSAVFVRNALMANTTSTTITCASGSNTAGALAVVAISGMVKAGAAAVRSVGSQPNQAASSTPAPALNQNALTRNVTLASVASADTTTTPNAAWSERQDHNQATPTTCVEVCSRDSGFTGTTITYGATQSTVYASHAIELNGDNEGVLAKTLGALTCVATGTVVNPAPSGGGGSRAALYWTLRRRRRRRR